MLYDELGIKSLGELEYACTENRLVNLFRFGERTQEKILKGIEFFRRHKGEFLFGEVFPLALRMKERLSQVAPGPVCRAVRQHQKEEGDREGYRRPRRE